MSLHHTILIVGGGAAGVAVANTYRRQDKEIDIAIIEPAEKHYYQPGFTVIGGGAYTMKETTKNEADLIHPSVTWIKEYAESFQPEANTVTLRSGEVVSYDYLVVCPGLQLDWHKVEGLQETIGKNNVCSNYSPDTVEYTWQSIKEMIAKGSGTALFTQPPMPIKCAGAPQKIMYLAADRFRKKGILEKFNIEFCTAGPAIFGIPFFAKALAKVAVGYGIKSNFNTNLVAIDGPNKTATFEVTDGEGNKTRIDKAFDMIHVTPPQSAPDFIKNSPLANAAGWVDVHDKTLQHTQYPNVFGLGDVASTGNAKTAAAVRKQVPVLVDNLTSVIKQTELREGYDGYGSCPLTTSLNGVILAEFAYGGKITPSFPFVDPRKSRWIWWLGKTSIFPWMYWHLMLKGYRFDIPHLSKYAEKFVNED
ncbi:MAG: NAD(P)/FAD-dependent oxidoreductase [Methylococcales bacterium]|nr:MAG: NAD(P)/FAD-dependent oxidoreductase [Methylococcales bacterium]